MKPFRICCLWRGCVLPVIALATVCWIVPEEAATQQVPAKERPTEHVPAKMVPPAPATEMETLKLKYARARDLARQIVEIWGKTPNLRVSVDDASNSVIVVAAQNDMVLVKRLISQLDVASGRREPEVSVRVFPLKYTQADAGVNKALNLLLVEGRFEVDPSRNVVIVSGDEKVIEAAERLLKRLDTPPDKPGIPLPIQVRVVWLASGITRKEARKPPEDVKEVVAELAKMGIEEPRLVTQALVTALPGVDFRVEGLAGLDSPFRLSISGTVVVSPGEIPTLHISINATQATVTPPTEANQVGRVDTAITAPLGHSVVLGMTPTATSTSVFVVQILPMK